VPANTRLFFNTGHNISVSNFAVVTKILIRKTPSQRLYVLQENKMPKTLKIQTYKQVAVRIEASKLHNRRNLCLLMLTQGQKEMAEGRRKFI